MGDRGNIVVRQEAGKNTEDVWLYAHWSGSDLPIVLQKALAREQRWTDPTYLTRIIFCEMVSESDNIKGEAGYGIGCSIGDNEHDILVVCIETQTVFQVPESALLDRRLPADLKAVSKQRWPFAEFATLKEEEQAEI